MSNTGKNINDIERHPAALFMHLWECGKEIDPSTRSLSVRERAPADLTKALAANEPEHGFHALLSYLPSNAELLAGQAMDVNAATMLLSAMRWIDEFVYVIHPRSMLSGPRAGLAVPTWLKRMRDARLEHGWYWESDSNYLIPRGPLSRRQRSETAAYADSFADRFAALSVTDKNLSQGGRTLPVRLNLVWTDMLRGVAAGRNEAGREDIAVAPVAEATSHIELLPAHAPHQGFVDIRLDASVDPVKTVIKMVQSAGGAIDIAVAPEFVMDEDAADRLATSLSGLGSAYCRLLIAGSGVTTALKNGQPWNESRLLNGYGAQLGAQRKLWPAGVHRDLAVKYGVKDTGPTELLMERTASGDVVEIFDVDSLGRCVVLICQDFQASPLAVQVIEQYQPDWVFVPILDRGIDVGRWAHQKAFALSTESPARFVLVSSTALAAAAGISPSPACALLIGPMQTDGLTQGRVIAEQRIDDATSDRYVKVNWTAADWVFTTLGSSDKP